MTRLLLILCAVLGLSLSSRVLAEENDFITIEVNDEVEVEIQQIGKTGRVSLIWFTCNQGETSVEYTTALELAKVGYQVYLPDMLSAHFLPPTPSNIATLEPLEMSQIINQIIALNPKAEYFLIGAARGAVPVLKALAAPELKHKPAIKGALLITPRITAESPEPGMDPVYIPEAGQSIVPIKILEGSRTPNRWGLPHLAETLSQSGSRVDTALIPGVRGFFYLRNDKNAAEKNMTELLDHTIFEHIESMRQATNDH